MLDIDDLYARMSALGIAMIPEIQGPPDWEGPDVLLRQTSFRALAEPRTFREADGTTTSGELRVRFGEVEQRGIALTAAGRDLYDDLTIEVDRRLADAPQGTTRVAVAAEVWREHLPRTETGLAVARARLLPVPRRRTGARCRRRRPRRPSPTCSTAARWSPSRSSTRTSSPARPPASSSPTSPTRARATTTSSAPRTTSPG